MKVTCKNCRARVELGETWTHTDVCPECGTSQNGNLHPDAIAADIRSERAAERRLFREGRL